MWIKCLFFIVEWFEFFFFIAAKPHWVQLIKDVELAVEDSLYWECRASGKPKPSYRWLKNGEALVLEVRSCAWLIRLFPTLYKCLFWYQLPE